MLQAKISIFFVSLMLSVVSATIVLSFRQFFLYVPFAGGVSFREIFAFVSQVGWISLLVVPPLLLRRVEGWSRLKTAVLIASASLYTFATLAIKANNVAMYGDPFAMYLLNYPALLFLEWLLPAFYIGSALLLRNLAIRSAASARRARLGPTEEPTLNWGSNQ